MKTNTEISRQALDNLRGNWFYVIIVYLVYFLVTGVSSPISVVIGGPLALGLAIFNLKLARGEEFNLDQIFQGFKNFGNAFGVYLLTIIIVALGMILFIIPGIIAAIMLSQVFFIMADEPQLGIVETLQRSRDMMDGNKWQYFTLILRFMLLSLLGIITFGIAFLWLIPYYQLCLTNFYEAIEQVEEQFV